MSDGSSSDGKHLESNYTAVLYVHGMGNQRRYEEVSRLVDALDKYVHHAPRKGLLTEIKAHLEPPRGMMDKDVSYIRVLHKDSKDKESPDNIVYRFYEYYWASITAGGQPVFEVAKWLLKRTITPFQTVFSPWRDRQRLRRAAFHRLAQKKSSKEKEAVDPGDLQKVLRAYNEFEGPAARRDYPAGTFHDFLSFIHKEFEKKPDTRKRLVELVKRWRSFYVRSELLTAATLMTLFLSIFLGVSALGGLAYILLNWANVIGRDLVPGGVGSSIQSMLEPDFKNTVSLLLMLASVLGLAGFLRDYLGDVQLWTTYEETDEKYAKRKEILEKGYQLLTHVLADERCERVVVVGHSLGTAIAFDMLLEAGRYNRARNRQDPMKGDLPLEKIDHFITLGSPIDKVHYFFESHRGKYHRYNRVVEEIRGDIGAVPFSRNGKPHMHWLNFWDQADLVSGSLETPSNNRWAYMLVDNIHVTNRLFPSPGDCHSAYFDNRLVVEVLHEVIFENKFSYHEAPLVPGEGKDYDSVNLGPGNFNANTTVFQLLIACLPWLIVLTLGLHVGGIAQKAGVVIQWMIYGIVMVVITFWSVSLFRGHLHPLVPPSSRRMPKNARS